MLTHPCHVSESLPPSLMMGEDGVSSAPTEPPPLCQLRAAALSSVSNTELTLVCPSAVMESISSAATVSCHQCVTKGELERPQLPLEGEGRRGWCSTSPAASIALLSRPRRPRSSRGWRGLVTSSISNVIADKQPVSSRGFVLHHIMGTKQSYFSVVPPPTRNRDTRITVSNRGSAHARLLHLYFL